MIRLAVAEDLPEVEAIEAELFAADAWGPAALRAELDGPGRRFVVADAGELLGYAVSMTLGEVVDLQRIGVRPSRQRSGVAAALLDDLVRQASASRMLLEVSASNRPAIDFYVRAGFTRIGVRRAYYRDGSDAFVMQRVLGED